MKFFIQHNKLHKYPVPKECQTQHTDEHLFRLRPVRAKECDQCFQSLTKKMKERIKD